MRDLRRNDAARAARPDGVRGLSGQPSDIIPDGRGRAHSRGARAVRSLLVAWVALAWAAAAPAQSDIDVVWPNDRISLDGEFRWNMGPPNNAFDRFEITVFDLDGEPVYVEQVSSMWLGMCEPRGSVWQCWHDIWRIDTRGADYRWQVCQVLENDALTRCSRRAYFREPDRADMNGDCKVNSLDLGLFRPTFLTAGPAGDLNGDYLVNSLDLGLLRGEFLQTPDGCGGGGW